MEYKHTKRRPDTIRVQTHRSNLELEVSGGGKTRKKAPSNKERELGLVDGVQFVEFVGVWYMSLTGVWNQSGKCTQHQYKSSGNDDDSQCQVDAVKRLLQMLWGYFGMINSNDSMSSYSQKWKFVNSKRSNVWSESRRMMLRSLTAKQRLMVPNLRLPLSWRLLSRGTWAEHRSKQTHKKGMKMKGILFMLIL